MHVDDYVTPTLFINEKKIPKIRLWVTKSIDVTVRALRSLFDLVQIKLNCCFIFWSTEFFFEMHVDDYVTFTLFINDEIPKN